MRAFVVVAIAILSSCSAGDPCAGIVPQSLPSPVDLGYVLPARNPFDDAWVGDGNGSVLFFLPESPSGSQYVMEVYNRGGFVTRSQGRFAEDTSIRRLTPLVQKRGYQLLEGDGLNIAKLNTYNSSGELIKSTSVTPAVQLVAAVESSGGSLVVSLRDIPAAPQAFVYPWTLWAQRFDEDGAPRGPARLVATDPLGQFMVTRFAGGVTRKGWTFVAWQTQTKDTPPTVADLQGAWIDPAGAVSPPLPLGSVLAGSLMDVAPLASGGVAVAGATSHEGPQGWLFRIREGEEPIPPGWLDAFPDSRMAIVHGGRAHALMVGNPFWEGAFKATECQRNISITFTTPEGKTCGAVSLPIPQDPALTCVRTFSSAALALDGSIVVRTLESGTDPDGSLRAASVATLWPRVLQ